MKIESLSHLDLAIMQMHVSGGIYMLDLALDANLASTYEVELQPVGIQPHLTQLFADKKLKLGGGRESMHGARMTTALGRRNRA